MLLIFSIVIFGSVLGYYLAKKKNGKFWVYETNNKVIGCMGYLPMTQKYIVKSGIMTQLMIMDTLLKIQKLISKNT